MFVGLTNTPINSDWGSRTAMAELLHRKPSGRPEAEYWLGTHHISPSILVEVPVAGPSGAKTLDQLVTLPFIMKVLAAETSLSLQAHPSPAQAIEGFERENAAGIPLDAPNRNYKDPFHKPELVYAVSDEFQAFCGFRPIDETKALLASLGPDPVVATLSDRLTDETSVRDAFEWLITGGDGVAELQDRVVELVKDARGPEFHAVETLTRLFPGDIGILLVLLMNYVTLRAGEVIYLPAGNIHAYQHGLGIEVLARSDNVLRGGLTPKFVDVPELLHVLDFHPVPAPYLPAHQVAPGVRAFRPDVPDFELVVITPAGATASFAPPTASILLGTGDVVTVTGALGSRTLAPGDAVYVSADESELTFTGSGTVFLAASQVA